MRRKTQLETPEVIQKKLDQGYGQGFGIHYRPWHEVGDFRSRGEQTIIRGLKIDRDHHYFSLIEYRHHLVAEFIPSVEDIREQYPILPIQESLDIAAQCGIKHPAVRGVPKVVTLDFLITVERDNVSTLVARSIKRLKDLSDPRVIEKLELERRLCVARNIPWELLTERELPTRMELNLVWLRRWSKTTLLPPSASQLQSFLEALSRQDPRDTLGRILESIARTLSISRSLAIWLFQYFVWHGHIKVDIFSPIQLTEPHSALRHYMSQL